MVRGYCGIFVQLTGIGYRNLLNFTNKKWWHRPTLPPGSVSILILNQERSHETIVENLVGLPAAGRLTPGRAAVPGYPHQNR